MKKTKRGPFMKHRVYRSIFKNPMNLSESLQRNYYFNRTQEFFDR